MLNYDRNEARVTHTCEEIEKHFGFSLIFISVFAMLLEQRKSWKFKFKTLYFLQMRTFIVFKVSLNSESYYFQRALKLNCLYCKHEIMWLMSHLTRLPIYFGTRTQLSRSPKGNRKKLFLSKASKKIIEWFCLMVFMPWKEMLENYDRFYDKVTKPLLQ